MLIYINKGIISSLSGPEHTVFTVGLHSRVQKGLSYTPLLHTPLG